CSVLTYFTGLIVHESQKPTYIACRTCALVFDDDSHCNLIECGDYIFVYINVSLLAWING
ncbi:hypothetical protein, partial [Staphylococcus xylosus]|uniref:hypothetical protein n=1 Tax=Staphylococcus xylosus TaxID=1288 RepID=UPI001C70B542